MLILLLLLSLDVYNSLTIHGLVDTDVLPSSVLEMSGFWRNNCYNIGTLPIMIN